MKINIPQKKENVNGKKTQTLQSGSERIDGSHISVSKPERVGGWTELGDNRVTSTTSTS